MKGITIRVCLIHLKLKCHWDLKIMMSSQGKILNHKVEIILPIKLILFKYFKILITLNFSKKMKI